MPVYWVVNLVDDCVEVHSQPTGTGDNPTYRRCEAYRSGEEVPVLIDGQEIGRVAAAAILGTP